MEEVVSSCLRDLDTIARSASSATESLEVARKSLRDAQDTIQADRAPKMPPNILGTGPNGLYVWRDLKSHLPSVADCEVMLRFYFDELSIYIRINQRSTLELDWQKLHDGRGIGENKVRILCTVLAMASGTAPAHSKVHKHKSEDHFRWVILMGSPLTSRFGHAVDNSFDRVLAMVLLAIYFLFMGMNDRLWEVIGSAIRRGVTFGLFDERSKAWDSLSHIDREYWRRLAWYTLSLERWHAFMRNLPFALHPDYTYLAEPSFQPDHIISQGKLPASSIVPTYPSLSPDGRLETHISARSRRVVKFVFLELVAICHEYLRNFRSMPELTRYNRARQLDELLERSLIEGLADTGLEHHPDLYYRRYLTGAALDTVPEERHLEVNLWVSSIFFLRSIITRRFLTDESAPQVLRFVSLTYSQGILSTIPMLTRLVKEGKVPVQLTWNSNHLLCAATTFAVVILGHDPGIDAENMCTSHVPEKEVTHTIFPTQQIEWLADNIFATLECLETLVSRGNATAIVAKRILEKLCGSQDELRTLYRQRFNAIVEKDWSRPESASLTGSFFAEAKRDDHASTGQTSAASSRVNSVSNASLHSSNNLSRPLSPSIGPTVSHPNDYYTSPSNAPSNFSRQSVSSSQLHSSSSFPMQVPVLPSQPVQASYSGHPRQHHPSTENYESTRAFVPKEHSYLQAPSFPESTHKHSSFLSTMNASSLLDAVLMDPVDLDLFGQNHTSSDVLASLLHTDTPSKSSAG